MNRRHINRLIRTLLPGDPFKGNDRKTVILAALDEVERRLAQAQGMGPWLDLDAMKTALGDALAEIAQASASSHTVLLPGREANGSYANVEVTLETFDRISEHVRKGVPLLDVEGVMASPELGIDDEIPYGAHVHVRVFVECDDRPMYEFQRIEAVA